MGVSLPSDLIVDVMRNADPGRLSAATSKLQAIGAEGVASQFADMLGDADAAPAQLDVSSQALAEGSSTAPQRAATQGQFVEFERMVLRNLLESLLPESSSGAFGGGPSAGVWRSVAADQLAGIYAGSGGVGIANALSPRDGEQAADKSLQWPYFSTGKIEAFVG
jgi:peptidoglycan hydrolase FlgJ